MCTAKTETAFGSLRVPQCPAQKECRRCTRSSISAVASFRTPTSSVGVMVENGTGNRQQGRCPSPHTHICMSSVKKIKFMCYNSHVDLQQTLFVHHTRPVGGLICIQLRSMALLLLTLLLPPPPVTDINLTPLPPVLTSLNHLTFLFSCCSI